MSNIHTRIDVNVWTSRFSLPEDLERAVSSAYVTGPEAVAVVEQARARVGGVATLGDAISTDVMVWAIGEPLHRAATKIGGVPHRPADAPWPTGRDGQPSTFVAQVCFAESRDVLLTQGGGLLRLPGEVLVLYSPNPSGLWDDDEEDPTLLQHEWWPIEIPHPMSAEDAPHQEWQGRAGRVITPCHAHLHRSADFPTIPENHRLREIYDPDRLLVFEGGKIGGVPFYARSESPRPGTFIASIGTINPISDVFPFVNVDTHPVRGGIWQDNFLEIGDLGAIYLFWQPKAHADGAGSLHWAVRGS